jgi:hypothetical protein
VEEAGSKERFGSHYVTVRDKEKREEAKRRRAILHQEQAALFKK